MTPTTNHAEIPTPETDQFMAGPHVAWDGMWIEHAKQLEQRLHAATAKLAELEEDSARLSWAVNHTEEFYEVLCTVETKWTSYPAKNELLWRAYIDAARSQSAQPDAKA